MRRKDRQLRRSDNIPDRALRTVEPHTEDSLMKRFSNLRSIVLAVMFAAIAAVLVSNGARATIDGNGASPTQAQLTSSCAA